MPEPRMRCSYPQAGVLNVASRSQHERPPHTRHFLFLCAWLTLSVVEGSSEGSQVGRLIRTFPTPPLILRLSSARAAPRPRAYFDGLPPRGICDSTSGSSDPVVSRRVRGNRSTLTLALSHRGRGDWTSPLPSGIRVMQRSPQGRGDRTRCLGATSWGGRCSRRRGRPGLGGRLLGLPFRPSR